VRVQLRRRALVAAFALLGAATAAPRAEAQLVDFNTTHSVFYESPSRTKMFVYTPGGNIQVSPTDWLDVRAGWEADVVSGASIAVKAGPAYQATHPAADVVTAASVHDLRNLARGGFTLRKDIVSLTAGYAYSTEHDYRSSSFNVAARTDTYDKNSQFEIAYARNFDSVCDRVQASDTSNVAPHLVALEDSTGCFTSSNLRTTRSIAIDSFQGGWTQTWTPTLATQLIYSAEIQNGFLSNPYRAVIIGEGLKAQEHHPGNRARDSIAARMHLYIRPLKAALRLGVRGYYDTWDIKSFTGEAEFEKHFGEAFRATVRGRFYKQSGAIFWSDDYTGGDAPLGPRGQYWSGDREISPFWSWMIGARAIYTIVPKERLLGIISSLKFSIAGDMMVFHYDAFTLAGDPIQNARAYLGTFSFTALF
jgi:hypothetical protein